MSISTMSVIECETRQEASEKVSVFIAQKLADEISQTGASNLLVSGGSTPKAMFQHLSKSDVDWSAVTVGLVDERCVPASHDSSNARLALENLLVHAAREATFVPMYRDGETPACIAASANSDYAALVSKSIVVLGMGSDAHTASWFPGAVNLGNAFDRGAPNVVAIDADGCEVAGEVTDRLTLTRQAISKCKNAVLMLFGDDKKVVFQQALTKKVEDAPIRAAVDDLGERLITVWAP